MKAAKKEVTSYTSHRKINDSKYEISDHLGNVRVVVSDTRIWDDVSGNGDGISDYTERLVTVEAWNDYYPFGMIQPGRNISSENYRYGFNGMEKDDEVKGGGNSYDYGARMYDPRLGRWLCRDPWEIRYAAQSPYNFVANSPIIAIDPNGKGIEITNIKVTETADGKIKITGSATLKIEIVNLTGLDNFKISGLNVLSMKLDKSLTGQLSKDGVFSINDFSSITSDGCDVFRCEGGSFNREIIYDISVNVQVVLLEKNQTISKDAHVVAIVNHIPDVIASDIEGSPMIKVAGLANSAGFDGGRVAVVSKDNVGSINTALHEVFHLLGLGHYWNNIPGDKGRNAMNYGKSGKKVGNSNQINTEQVYDIWFNILGYWGDAFYLKKANDSSNYSKSSKEILKEFLKDENINSNETEELKNH